MPEPTVLRGAVRVARAHAVDTALTRFANSEIHQNVASNEVFVNLRFVRGRRVGVASSGRMDDEGIHALQIEIARRLYCDARTHAPRADDVARLRAFTRGVASALASAATP